MHLCRQLPSFVFVGPRFDDLSSLHVTILIDSISKLQFFVAMPYIATYDAVSLNTQS